MNITNNQINVENQIQSWIEQGLEDEIILVNLKKAGLDDIEISDLHAKIKKIRNKKRTQTGSMLVLIGVLILGLGFISCIVLHYLGNDINFSLYGLTGIGAVTLIIGLILIFC